MWDWNVGKRSKIIMWRQRLIYFVLAAVGVDVDVVVSSLTWPPVVWSTHSLHVCLQYTFQMFSWQLLFEQSLKMSEHTEYTTTQKVNTWHFYQFTHVFVESVKVSRREKHSMSSLPHTKWSATLPHIKTNNARHKNNQNAETMILTSDNCLVVVYILINLQ